MNFREFWTREKQVIVHGQPRSFRIKKWVIILAIAVLLYWWKGFYLVLGLFLLLASLGTCVHFILRWKTHGWKKAWGPFDPQKVEGRRF